MNIILWILQVLLAAQFLQHGLIMVFRPAELIEVINANINKKNPKQKGVNHEQNESCSPF